MTLDDLVKVVPEPAEMVLCCGHSVVTGTYGSLEDFLAEDVYSYEVQNVEARENQLHVWITLPGGDAAE